MARSRIVIPAKAGIQTESRVCGDMNPILFRAAARKDWIPAFAGMTTETSC